MNNNARYDLSDRLIHFFRAVDTQNSNTPTLPEHWSFASIENFDEPLSPFFLMRPPSVTTRSTRGAILDADKGSLFNAD